MITLTRERARQILLRETGLLRQESALRGLSAVKEGHIVTLHPSLFSTSSIEIVTAAEELARAADEMLARTRKGHR